MTASLAASAQSIARFAFLPAIGASVRVRLPEQYVDGDVKACTAGVDNAELSKIAWHLVHARNCTDTNTRPRRSPTRDAPTDPPTHDAALHLLVRLIRQWTRGARWRHSRRRERMGVRKVEYEVLGGERMR
ncbi:hypothetical protein EDB92DRAFT_1818978 [Lactarius akahatsu]|uniref:Uncharacterized protein n=1 Tax=Lactarius akahatsu TaxID=416441 RepID=A0AAD4LF00_9AGAM|nr:hypothetical protein EDB92DRAFT_1818978 [Lactarius akahatsu]